LPQRHRTVVVHHRIAEVDRDRVAAVTGANLTQPLCRERKRVIPADRLERAGGGAAQRATQSIRIVVHRAGRDPLGAHVPVREHVVVVGPDRHDAVVRDVEL
jgi:hypothetical protein